LRSRNLVEALLIVLSAIIAAAGLEGFLSTLTYVLISPPAGLEAEGYRASLLVSSGLSLAARVALCFGLVLWRRQISAWLTPDAAVTGLEIAPLVAVGIALLGVWYLALGAVYLVDRFQLFLTGTPIQWEYLREGIAELAVGALLVWLSSSVPRIWPDDPRKPRDVA